jgi:asparagine synthase (glutamine-hydrolysing)
VAASEDEPFGGLPTLAYARLFERARAQGVIVLLDGQGMDEQWAGYDYYRENAALTGCANLSDYREAQGGNMGPGGNVAQGVSPANLIQGVTRSPTRPSAWRRSFARSRNRLTRRGRFRIGSAICSTDDAIFTKIPRALRFNDRASMRSSTELREPFLDHRLFELALRQPPDRKIGADTGKCCCARWSRGWCRRAW